MISPDVINGRRTLWFLQYAREDGPMTDFRWFVGGIFAAFAAGLLAVHCPIWSLFPAVVGVYILGSKLLDELRR